MERVEESAGEGVENVENVENYLESDKVAGELLYMVFV